jgi:hypothetical protein
MQPLTPRQIDVIEAIRALSAEGHKPSLRRLAAHLGMKSTGGLRHHLLVLQLRGEIVRPFNTPGGISLGSRAA